MAFILILGSIGLVLIVYPCLQIAQNYFQARKLGLPILITPSQLSIPAGHSPKIILHQFLLSVNTPPASSLSSFRFHPLFNHDWNFNGRYATHNLPFDTTARIPDRLPRRDSTYRFRWLCR